MKEEKSAVAAEQAAQQDFQKRQNELLAPIIEKAKNAIDKVAAAGGYLAVFDTSTGPRSQEIESLREYPDMKKAPAIPAPFSCPSPSGDQKRHKAVHFVRR